MKYQILVLAAILLTISGICQKSGNDQNKASDTTSKTIKSYNELIDKKTVSHAGLITVHEKDDKVYFEIGRHLMQKQLLAVTRISKGRTKDGGRPEEVLLPGDEVNNIIIHFRQGPGERIFLERDFFTIHTADTTKTMEQAVGRAEIPTIIASFKIAAYTPDSSAVLIDMTDFIQSDNEIFGIQSTYKEFFGLGGLTKENGYLLKLNTFSKNVEVTTAKTYSSAGKPSRFTANGLTTVEINTSIVELPDAPLRTRYADPRVGYFYLNEQEYSINKEAVSSRQYIKRWRLEPREEDKERYLRGELVEPRQPIVFYIDPATPQKFVPYLIRAVQNWRKPLEQAGFKNAIFARRAPTASEDPTWNLYDAKNSVIIYKASDIENASGPSISDPRTGEILESHINWYHNVQKLLHDWYMVQCAAVDTAARTMFFSDSLMGQLVEFVCTHEVGHTLGLLHNMGASSAVPVDSLRSDSYLDSNGICPSIMDYARFNYVTQPGDHVSGKNLIGRIGVYDNWAIEWGYRWFGEGGSAETERQLLNKLTTEKNKDRRCFFGSEVAIDPRCQREDLGDDPIKASNYGIANLKRIVPHLIHWTNDGTTDYAALNNMYGWVQRQYMGYLKHASSYINSGMLEDQSQIAKRGSVYHPLDGRMQRACMQFLMKEVLSETPMWLLDTAIIHRTGQTSISVMTEVNTATLRGLLFFINNSMLYTRNELDYDSKVYGLHDFFEDIHKSVWKELNTHQRVDPYRRLLQSLYVKQLTNNFIGDNVGVLAELPTGYFNFFAPEVSTTYYNEINYLKKALQKAQPLVRDRETKAHYGYLVYRIDKFLKEFTRPGG